MIQGGFSRIGERGFSRRRGFSFSNMYAIIKQSIYKQRGFCHRVNFMRKRNLWKAAGIMAAGVLTVSMAGGETARVYASETKTAVSADKETEKDKNEKSKTVTPVLLLDKDGKPVIGPDGKPVYVTPTPAKEADAKPVPDASGTESKEDASGVPADEGQQESGQEASVLSSVTAEEPVVEFNAAPVPIPEETESAAAADMEDGASSEEIPPAQEESTPEESADNVDNGNEAVAADGNLEKPEDSSAEKSAPEVNTETPADTASADHKASDGADVSGEAKTAKEESSTGDAAEDAGSSEDISGAADAGKEVPSDPEGADAGVPELSDEAAGKDAGVRAATDTDAETAEDISDGTLPAASDSAETSGTVTVTSVRNLFTNAVIPAATAYSVEEEESPSFFAALIGATESGAAQDEVKESAKEAKDAESVPASAGDANSAESASASSEDTDAAGKDSSSNREEAVVYEIDAVTEELAGPGTNQLVGNTDTVGTKTVTADSASASAGGYSGSSSYSSSSSSSSGSGSSGSASGTSYQNTSPGATAVRTANPKTGDTNKARVYFGTAFASLAAIFKVMLETERAKKKIRR